MRKIRHIGQPTNMTCVQACLAMALNKDVNEVILDIGGEPLNLEQETRYLVQNGVFPIHLTHQVGGVSLPFRGIYMVTTPSLNQLGRSHRVLFSFYEESVIYDPAFNPELASDEQTRKYHYGSVFQSPDLHFYELTYLNYDIVEAV